MRSAPAVLLASMMACRKEPEPVSLVFNTVKVAVNPTMGDKNTLAENRQRSRRDDLHEVAFTAGAFLPQERDRNNPQKKLLTRGTFLGLVNRWGNCPNLKPMASNKN